MINSPHENKLQDSVGVYIAHILDKGVSVVIVEGQVWRTRLFQLATTRLSSSASNSFGINRSSRQGNIGVNALSNSKEQIPTLRFQNLARSVYRDTEGRILKRTI